MFNKPIGISIPAAMLPNSTNLPYPLFMNTVTHEFIPINKLDTITTGAKNLLKNSITTSEYIPLPPGYRFWTTKIYVRCDGQLVMPDLSALPLDQLSLAALAVERVLLESDCVTNPCRCCDFDAVSEDFDSTSNSNDGCYSVYSNGSVKYLNCPEQPTESWNLEESTLNVKVNPGSAQIKIDEIAKFTVNLTNDNDDPVTGFSITNVAVNDGSVITTRGYDDKSVWFQGLSGGTSGVAITIEADGCQYKAWLTVEVVDEVSFVTNADVLIVTEGCRNIFQVKLDSEPSSPVNATVSNSGGDPDISIENGSALNFDESNWNIDQTVILYAQWDEDNENGSTQFEISGDSPSNDYTDVGNISITAKEHDISKVELSIEGSSSKFNEGSAVELHDTLSGT